MKSFYWVMQRQAKLNREIMAYLTRGEFYSTMNDLGYREFLVDKQMYIEFCDGDQELIDQYEYSTWVYDPEKCPGTYQDTTGEAVFVGFNPFAMEEKRHG